MKLGEGMRRGIIRRKHRRRKRQHRKLGIRLVLYKLSRGVGGVRLLVLGIGVLRLKHKDKVKWDLLLSSGNSNNSDLNSLLLNNNNNLPRNNTEVLLFNINPLLSNTNNNNHPLDHLNCNNNNHINKSPVVIPKDRDNNKIDYQDRVINRLLSLINPNSSNNSNNNNRSRDGRINLNPLPSLSLRRQYPLLINLGIDLPKLLLRLNNRRIMNLGPCKSTLLHRLLSERVVLMTGSANLILPARANSIRMISRGYWRKTQRWKRERIASRWCVPPLSFLVMWERADD
jgi:hypothetical protein